MLATLAAAFALVLAWGDAGIKHLTRDWVLAALRHDADDVIAALVLDDTGRWRVDPGRLKAVYQRVYSGHYYRVVNETTDLASRSLWDYELSVEPLEPGTAREGIEAGPSGQTLLTAAAGIEKSGTRFTVAVAEDIAPLDEARRDYALTAAGLLAGIMLLLVLVQQGILKRGFDRLDRVRLAVRELRGGGERPLPEDVPVEIAPLVAEINRLLERLEGKVARSRNAMGNLAHELKRPMSRLRRLADELEPGKEGRLVATIDELESVVMRELKRARIVGVATPGRHTRLGADLPALVEALEHLYPGRTITTRFRDDLVLPHDRDDMLELFGNLLDNALKHGAGEVSLTVTEGPDHWLIEVSDGGRGIPQADMERVTARGVRLDERRAGSGLGLGICADIVREYGGEIRFANGPRGGLTVAVRLARESVDDGD